MKYIIGIARILVGSLFIFSGMIKANDPLGFSYKLEEYWVEFGMGWDWLLSLGLPLAAGICILEIVLGVAVLVAYRMNLVARLLLTLIVFFTILTFASAEFGLVKSCGCFGDAIPLTPWQSFVKDIILLLLIIIIFAYKKEIVPYKEVYKDTAFVILPVVLMTFVSFKVGWNFPLYFTFLILGIGLIASLANVNKAPAITTGVALLASCWLCLYSIRHLPMKDFRPYAVGKSISEQMKLPEGAVADVYENIFKYKNLTTGKVEEFRENDYPWDDANYEFVDRETNLIKKGDEAKITDFAITSEDGYNLTEDVLNDPDPIVLIISYNISKAADDEDHKLKKLIEDCQNSGLSVIGLSASDESILRGYLQKNNLDITFNATDEITLKTMVRSNPGIMVIKSGTVLGKWHLNDTPELKDIQSLI